MMKRQGGDVFI